MTYNFNERETEQLLKLESFMLEYNEQVNLTRITEHDEIWEKHFVDSVLPLKLFDVPRGTNLIDIGTGAGFPAIPIKICRDDINITMLDSLRKRTDYLTKATNMLSVSAGIIHGRSEIIAYDKKHREKYDIAISRAVANLPSLIEYCLAFVKVGGHFLAMKGAESETENVSKILEKMGGEICDKLSYELPSGDKRHLIIIKKISQTPPMFPRKRVNITKNPLI